MIASVIQDPNSRSVVMSSPPPTSDSPPRKPRSTQRIQQPRRATSSFRIPTLPADAPAATSGSADRLKSFLTGLEGERAGSLLESLSRATYLITDRVAGPAAGSPSGARRGALGAVIAGAVLIVLFGAFALHRPAQHANPGGPLWVESLEGGARGSKSGDLAERKPVSAGDVLSTGPKGVLTLVTPTGDHVTMQPSSQCTFTGLSSGASYDTPRYLFRDAAGDITFDFRLSAEIEVRVGPRCIRAARASLVVARDRSAPSLTVVSGTAYLTHDRGEKTIVLKSGDTIGLE